MDALGPSLFCWPASGNSVQAVEIVRAWLIKNEGLLNKMSGPQVVISAFY